MDNVYWMKEALKLAVIAKENKEIPVGAVVVMNNKIIGRGYNEVERLNDPTAHAEIIAITSASQTIKNWRLDGATIYVTLEPCPMCAGAILASRISKCVFGTRNSKFGGIESVYQIKSSKTNIEVGVLEDECRTLMEEFFKTIRKNKK
jgi:tRNA(adenine34) deaminase